MYATALVHAPPVSPAPRAAVSRGLRSTGAQLLPRRTDVRHKALLQLGHRSAVRVAGHVAQRGGGCSGSNSDHNHNNSNYYQYFDQGNSGDGKGGG